MFSIFGQLSLKRFVCTRWPVKINDPLETINAVMKWSNNQFGIIPDLPVSAFSPTQSHECLLLLACFVFNGILICTSSTSKMIKYAKGYT